MRMYSVICVYCTCGYPLLYIISKTERYTCRSIVFVIALRPPRRTRLRTRVSICEPIINLGTRRLAVCGPAPPCLCMPASALLPASPHPSEVFDSPRPALRSCTSCSAPWQSTKTSTSKDCRGSLTHHDQLHFIHEILLSSANGGVVSWGR